MLKSGVILDKLTRTYIYTCTHMYLCTHLVAAESREVPRYLDGLCIAAGQACPAYVTARLLEEEEGGRLRVASAGIAPATHELMQTQPRPTGPSFKQLQAHKCSSTYVVAYKDLPPPGEPRIRWPRDPRDTTSPLPAREMVRVCDCE